ncbi:MAG: hypothetical protein ALECFALPRED_007049 [Alectoria fallacina]|uniref:Cellulase n=1 Tax=Alectoria fallacina TaxID=1903189 RepID=A0A8H3EVF1_9LECA|nr:MAG: hypothetical protein ALECFALPRED_007049 [Alectoria fallacina]
MSYYLTAVTILVLLGASADPAAAQSGSGTTTRYWDCCKPSCAWSTSGITSPVKTCDVSDNPLTDPTAQSGCAGGTAYMCSDQSPWSINNDLAYGFAAVSASNPYCCSCYQLTFTSTVLSGKKMIVQATNTGDDVGSTQFDLAIPGGGFGQFDGCSTEWKATSAVWGVQYGGPSSNTCTSFPTALQPGCGFRWDWMQGADNPTYIKPSRSLNSITDTISVDWEVVTCPAELVAKSGCSVTGYNSANAPSAPASSPAAPAPSSKAPASFPPAALTSKPPVNSPVETSTTSPQAAAPATTLSPVVVHSSPLVVPTKAALPPKPAKAAPAHPHWTPHEHQKSPEEEKEHAEWTPPEHQEWANEEGKQDNCNA